MTNIKLRHVDRFTDRHGKVRYYFRRVRGARIRCLDPSSSEFLNAYHAALNSEPQPVQSRHRDAAGTFDRLLENYFQSPDYLRLDRLVSGLIGL